MTKSTQTHTYNAMHGFPNGSDIISTKLCLSHKRKTKKRAQYISTQSKRKNARFFKSKMTSRVEVCLFGEKGQN